MDFAAKGQDATYNAVASHPPRWPGPWRGPGRSAAPAATRPQPDHEQWSRPLVVSGHRHRNLTVTVPGADVVMVGAGDIADAGQGAGQTAAPHQRASGRHSLHVWATTPTRRGRPAISRTTTTPPGAPSRPARTRPSATTTGPTRNAGYFPYFGAQRVGSPNGYYSYDLGSYWHAIVLNTEIDYSVGSAQELWLRADLAANAGKNVVAYFTGRASTPETCTGARSPRRRSGAILYEFGADLVVNGHEHWYERFARRRRTASPTRPTASARSSPGRAAGRATRSGTLDANSEVHDGSTWGVLKLTLHQTSYDWQFLPVAGGSFTDSGTGPFHAAPPGRTSRAERPTSSAPRTARPASPRHRRSTSPSPTRTRTTWT